MGVSVTSNNNFINMKEKASKCKNWEKAASPN